MAQSQEEKDRLLELGEDGRIFCLDLSHNDGQTIALALAHDFPEVATELRNRSNNRLYLLVLIAASRPKPIVMLVDPHDLVDAMTNLYHQSREYGNAFAVISAPKHTKISDLIAELQQTQGNA